MDARTVLLARIRVAADNLDQVVASLDVAKVGPLRTTVSTRLRDLLVAHRSRLTELERTVIGDGLPADAWTDLRKWERQVQPVIRECLGLLQGSLIRRQGLDSGICEVAEAMLTELSERSDLNWRRLTVMEEAEFFDRTVQVIRLRFPEATVWNLPVAAHEFGHFAAREFREDTPDGRTYRHPVTEFIGDRRMTAQKLRLGDASELLEDHLHELFADLFGAFTLGPAFACSCILLRFRPERAYQATGSHPCPAERVHLILWTLRRVSERHPNQPFHPIVDLLRTAWSTAVAAAGDARAGALDQRATARLRRWARALLACVDRDDLPRLPYRDLSAATALKAALPLDDAAPAAPPPDYSIADVLNAAWLQRLNGWEDPRLDLPLLNRRALALCRR